MSEFFDFIKNFFEIFKYMNFKNVLDVLILTLFFYQILKTIRHTKAEQLVKGFVFILFVMKMSEILGLVALTWIIKGTLNFGVIAFIIIFQPEFRRILEKIGQRNWMGNKKLSEEDSYSKIIHILEKASFKLSKSKTGALIVISRSVSLKEYYENATLLDAIVSTSLLENIFVNETPLHDGAVIIQEDRIKAANCIMPLTDKELPVEFGTRHRAAIGISETCDAVSIIVSEETGKVSICHDGIIVRCKDKIAFQKELRDLLISGNDNSEKLLAKGERVWNRLKKIK